MPLVGPRDPARPVGLDDGRAARIGLGGDRRTATRVTREDCLTVIAFDTSPTVYVPLQVADNPSALRAAVAPLTAGGGTDFVSALGAAFAQLERATAAETKLVLFLTDGQAPHNGIDALVERHGLEEHHRLDGRRGWGGPTSGS